MQRLFSDYVGVGPQWVLKRYRLHDAVEQIDRRGDVDWTRFALDLGYYDHAHFNRDFRALVGRTPAQYGLELGG
jgi:AraC-like DNA-binding protein